MSSLVCGKRSSSIFDEYQHISPPLSAKRIRCRGSPTGFGAVSDLVIGDDREVKVEQLRSIFANVDPQLLVLALESSGNDMDSAIKRLNDFHAAKQNSPSGTSKSDMENAADAQSEGGILASNNGVLASPAADVLPTNGSEWVELFVREMMSASDVNDARTRTTRVLGLLEKTIMATANAGASASAEAVQMANKENTHLKEQIEAFIKENSILKRAVAIQHERQKVIDVQGQEFQHLKQLVSQYQEQVKTLEMSNYALRMHLRQAEQHSPIPGRFRPDVM